MQTERLYEQDPYVRKFKALIIQNLDVNGQPAVILDKTLFYPTSGGQPCDFGILSDVPVVDVIEQNDQIVHVLKQPLISKDEIQGEIDWERRFDHMQQHTGQHILSQVFVQKLKANTIAFHLGVDYTTIDIDKSNIDVDTIHDVESVANQIVLENRSVKIHTVSPEKRHTIPFRRTPKVEGDLRVREIENFDWVACCGTHVGKTGEVGLIKVVKAENYKGGMRISFLCGWRALKDYQKKTIILRDVGRLMTSGEDDLPVIIKQWIEEKKEKTLRLKEMINQKLEVEVQALLENSENIGSVRIVCRQFKNRDPDEIKMMMKKLLTFNNLIVFLGLDSQKAFLFFGRSQSVDIDVRLFFEKACKMIHGKGGGSLSLAQGSGSDTSNLSAALDEAKELLLSSLNS